MNGHTYRSTTQVVTGYHHIKVYLLSMHMDEKDQNGHIDTLDVNHIRTLPHNYENSTIWPFQKYHLFT